MPSRCSCECVSALSLAVQWGVAIEIERAIKIQEEPPSQIGWVHDFIKIILISYCMVDNDIQLVVCLLSYVGLKS